MMKRGRATVYRAMKQVSACRATHDFVSSGTLLGIVRQGLNEELSSSIVA
jgi:hypothetical protein